MSELQFFITQEDIDAYSKASGDYNPLHLDEEYAKSHGYSGTIAHGMLTMAKIWSVLSTRFLTEKDFPERYDLSFLSPVYAGCLVILRVEPQANGFQVEGSCNEQTVVKGFIEV